MSTAPRRARLLAGVTTAFIALSVVVSAPGASAHSDLVSSVPENAATLSLVSDVTLTFADEIVGEYTELTLSSDSSDVIELDTPTLDSTNTAVTARIVSAPLPDGTYVLDYYVVSIDGHPIDGTVEFLVDGAPAPAPAPAPEPVDSGSSITPETVPAETPAPVAVDGEPRLLTTMSTPQELTWVWIGTAVATVLVLAAVSAVLLIALRRRRDAQTHD